MFLKERAGWLIRGLAGLLVLVFVLQLFAIRLLPSSHISSFLLGLAERFGNTVWNFHKIIMAAIVGGSAIWALAKYRSAQNWVERLSLILALLSAVLFGGACGVFWVRPEIGSPDLRNACGLSFGILIIIAFAVVGRSEEKEHRSKPSHRS